MELQDHIQYWLESAEHDLQTAEALFSSERYDWCLFLAHLVLEKTLKALYVQDNANALPPRTHNLLRLAGHTRVQLTEDHRLFLDEVNDFNLEVRYPEFKREFYKICTRDFAEKYFDRIKEMHGWLRSRLK